MTENIIFEHAAHSISTKKFIAQINEEKSKLDMAQIRNYIDDLLKSSLVALDETEEVLLRSLRETI